MFFLGIVDMWAVVSDSDLLPIQDGVIRRGRVDELFRQLRQILQW